MNLEQTLSNFPRRFSRARLPQAVLDEAKKRVLDSLACFYGAYREKPVRVLRDTLTAAVSGEAMVWGTTKTASAELAVWANGAGVRALDYNDTYLSKEPCHPSDLLAPLWAACELSGSKQQGRRLLEAMVLAYETVCRLCDAYSLRARGWDHVTYLPIASALGSSYILGLTPDQTRHAVALSITGNSAMRQTRVGMISDWKAACAAYAARSGLWAARLAKAGFTGPSDIFSGRHGFFKQVAGAPFSLSFKSAGHPWMILKTHTKYFPAEHHGQSAIEAAIQLRRPGMFAPTNPSYGGSPSRAQSVVIDTFDVAVSIIGSEKEKWQPSTRETADHSLPYLTAIALLEGDVNLHQYEKKRFLNPTVRALMKKTRVRENKTYTRQYPALMPTRVTVRWKNGRSSSVEIRLPKGYAGRPMTWQETEQKFRRLAGPIELVAAIEKFESVDRLRRLAPLMKVGR